MADIKRYVAATALAAALSASGMQAAPAAPAGFGQLAGAGTASGLGGCTGPVAVAGVSTGSTWSFTVGFAGAGTSLCAAAGVPVASGTWNPAAGGCLIGGTGSVCVGAVTSTGMPVTSSISFCLVAGSCYSGSATVVRL